MTIDELRDRLRRLENAGRITGETEVFVRDPEISAGAMKAGSNGWTDLEEILAPDSERIMLAPYMD